MDLPTLALAVCLGGAVCGPPIQAQAVSPTAPTAASGPTATATRVFHNAWVRITIGDEPKRSRAFPFAATVEAVIPSNRERVMWATRITTRADLANVDPEGKLRLSALPSEVPFVLRISTHDRQGVAAAVYTQDNRLQFPDDVQVGRLGFWRALEQAGFLGDFFIDQVDGTVRRRDK
jgi:hypothetical protein